MRKILIIGATSVLAKDFTVTYKNKYKFYFAARNTHESQEKSNFIKVDFNNFDETCFKALPKLDGVIYFAGITSHSPVKLSKRKNYDEVFNANFYGAFISISTLLRNNKINNEASLVFLSSLAAKFPYFGGALYTSSKLALEGLVKTLALELANKKIKVNAVSPSFVESEMADSVTNFSTKETIEQFKIKHPFGYVNKSEVSSLIDFLLEKNNNSITGQIIQIGNLNTGMNS